MFDEFIIRIDVFLIVFSIVFRGISAQITGEKQSPVSSVHSATVLYFYVKHGIVSLEYGVLY